VYYDLEKNIPKLIRCATVCVQEKKVIVQPQILCNSICWSRGKRKEILVDLKKVIPMRIMRMTIIVGLKFKHCPAPLAIANAAPYKQQINKLIYYDT